MPSTAVQFTAADGWPHNPGFVAVTAWPLGAAHVPPQQSAALKQMSAFWMHHDPAMSQTLFLLQSPEQQSLPCVHAFPAVLQEPVPPIGAHLPPVQVCVQHVLPDVGHVSPTDTHCVAPHVPFTHEPEQQSVPTAQPAPDAPHTEIDEAHLFPRHR
jgi:hypothetical protein